MKRDAAMEAWIDEARGADCWAVLNRLAIAHRVKASRRECVGPCPACGGTDRFSINRQKNLWFCRMSGKGGDAIALAEYLLGVDFLGAVEQVTGQPPPRGARGLAPDPAVMAERARLNAEREAAAARENNEFRAREIRRAHDIWSGAAALAGSPAEAYLGYRGVAAAPGAKLRARVKLPYWHQVAGVWTIIHEGPAMVAAIQGRDGMFIGCHCTWIDAVFKTRSGKALIAHPETGELLDAKKVRGSQKGGHIHLGGDPGASRLIVGEGIETVYAVRRALLEDGEQPAAATLWWAAINLGNIGGKASQSVTHPHATITDARGRVRRARVPGPLPDLSDAHVLLPPDDIADIVILGDGDSDRFMTRNTLLRAAARWAMPGRTVRAAWADEGSDFNDMLQGAP